MNYNIPRDCRRRSSVLSLSGKTKSRAQRRPCSQQVQPDKVLTGPRKQQHVPLYVWKPSNLSAQRFAV